MKCACVAFVLLGLGVIPAQALDVNFSGTVSSICSLALSTPGLLGLSVSGSTLGSEEPGGAFAVVTVLSIGSANVTVGAPARTAAPTTPVAYNATGEVVEVAYQGLTGLSGVTQTYTAAQTQFAVSAIPLSVLRVHTRISNDNGFPAGAYATRTVLTCS